MRDLLDLDHIMWGSDFPHSVSSFPQSPRWLDEIFAGCSEQVRRQVLVDNPCRFFHLDPERELTATP
jgi:predicted TIM-barrel fold metal-dependent hydrolase